MNPCEYSLKAVNISGGGGPAAHPAGLPPQQRGGGSSPPLDFGYLFSISIALFSGTSGGSPVGARGVGGACFVQKGV